jgi:farnesyl diphosphate synthase
MENPMTKSDTTFETRLAAAAHDVERLLDSLLSGKVQSGETARPGTLLAAMRHAVLNGGKRLRPFLVIESARLLGGNDQAALHVAAALECVHCYSLVHDDLPAMDNDDMRRGKPTVHIAFDEATAILAGDSLLTLAFDIIADPATGLAPEQGLQLVLGLARAAGLGGMAGGQALDIEAEKIPPGEAGIMTLQAMKTGALIRYACEAGAIIAGTTDAQRRTMADFGAKIGLAFQLADDLLDMTADSTTLGKAAGKDAARGKGTLPALHGEAWARQKLADLVADAEVLLAPFGDKGDVLKATAHFVANRKN